MFEIFKRSKIREWEILLLKNILSQLPAEFKALQQQIDEGLLNGVLTDTQVPSAYVAFSYNQKVFSQLHAQFPAGLSAGPNTEKQSDYKITGIRVYDKKSKSQLLYTMYISNGMLHGYSIKGADSFSLDIDKTDVSWFAQIFREEHDLNKTKKD